MDSLHSCLNTALISQFSSIQRPNCCTILIFLRIGRQRYRMCYMPLYGWLGSMPGELPLSLSLSCSYSFILFFWCNCTYVVTLCRYARGHAEIVATLLQPRVTALSPNVQSIYMQNCLKIFAYVSEVVANPGSAAPLEDEDEEAARERIAQVRTLPPSLKEREPNNY